MILFVDDDQDLAGMILLGLTSPKNSQRIGFRTIRYYYEPREALDFVHKVVSGEVLVRDGIELVITDYDMPGMNGAELATEIRKVLPDVPILFHTGTHKKIEYFENSFIRKKGCSITDLINDIEELI